MKLFHYERPDGISNFGDALNPWIWPKLLPDVLDDDGRIAFIAIGTLLNDVLASRTPEAVMRLVFGTGAGYGPPPSLDDSTLKIYCVRGPLTAGKLGLPGSLAVCDPGVLVRTVFRGTGRKKHRYSFMPHVHHAVFGAAVWPEICRTVDFGYVDPGWSVERVLQAIDETEVLITEAMHGAIIAEALRVPWIPVVTSVRIDRFKWEDWCASIGQAYRPTALPPLAGVYPRMGRRPAMLMRTVGHLLRARAVAPSTDPARSMAPRLLAVSRKRSPVLSSDQQIDSLTQGLLDRLEVLKRDVAAGVYETRTQPAAVLPRLGVSQVGA